MLNDTNHEAAPEEETSVKPKPKKWSREELKAAVKVYQEIDRRQQAGEKISKTSFYKKLNSEYPERSAKSFEFRMCNISAVYQILGRDFATGLKPANNVGANVIIEIKSIIAELEST